MLWQATFRWCAQKGTDPYFVTGSILMKTGNGLEWRPLLDPAMVNEAVMARAAVKNPQGVARLNELADIRAMHVTVAGHAVAEVREALGGLSPDA